MLKRLRQTGHTQIRLLLKKQSDQGLPWLLFWQAFLLIQALATNIWEQEKKSVQKCLDINSTSVWSGSALFVILTSIFVNFSPDNHHFTWEQEKKSVQKW